jgi:glycosyltransferase involved in cell wall biosynthesis
MSKPLRCWIITVGEPLLRPGNAGGRLLRSGLLAREWVAAGHEATWWTGSFDHTSKSFWPEAQHGSSADADASTSVVVEGVAIRFLRSSGYASNVSFARLRDHALAARSFSQQAATLPRPDVILCSLPTLELCEAAVRFARERGIPIALDIRDLWPDVFLTAAGPGLNPLIRPLVRALIALATTPYRRMARRSLKRADAIVACSPGYLKWGLSHAQRAVQPADAVFALGNVAPRAPDLTSLTPELQALVRSHKRIIMFAGVFGHSYDLATPIEAARLLLGQTSAPSDVLWLFAGKGDHSAALQARAAGLPNVVFTGWLESAALNALLHHAWLGLAAYHDHALQSLPNKPFDYLSHGVPLLNSLTGELSELVAEKSLGWNYRSGDAAGLAALVQRLQTADAAPEVAAAAARGKALFAVEYDAAVIYPRFVKYLEALAGKPVQQSLG